MILLTGGLLVVPGASAAQEIPLQTFQPAPHGVPLALAVRGEALEIVAAPGTGVFPCTRLHPRPPAAASTAPPRRPWGGPVAAWRG